MFEGNDDPLAFRSMPEDFAPEITEQDGIVRGEYDGALLGYKKPDDPDANAKYMQALKQALWQASEAKRLGEPLNV